MKTDWQITSIRYVVQSGFTLTTTHWSDVAEYRTLAEARAHLATLGAYSKRIIDRTTHWHYRVVVDI